MSTGKGFMHRSAEHNTFYTHYSLTDQFIELEKFKYNASCVEPACGLKKAISSRIFDKFKHFYETDIIFGNDFYDMHYSFDYLITNPPYGKETDKFVSKAKEVTKKKFAMLLRTNYLSGQARYLYGDFPGRSLWDKVKRFFIKKWDKGIYSNLKRFTFLRECPIYELKLD